MRSKGTTIYGILSLLVLIGTVCWFAFSIYFEVQRGTQEAERSFSWIARETTTVAISDGFMSDIFIQQVTDLCKKSRLLSAVVISTPAGTVYVWPDKSPAVQYDVYGKPQIVNTSVFMKVYSTNLDIGDSNTGAVIMTAILHIMESDIIFSASRNAFLIVLALFLCTLIVILVSSSKNGNGSISQPVHTSPEPKITANTRGKEMPEEVSLILKTHQPNQEEETQSVKSAGMPETESTEKEAIDRVIMTQSAEISDTQNTELPGSFESDTGVIPTPEGLFSPVTGIGWEQYLEDRLDAELVRAASSEQDLALIITRIAGLLHTDMAAKKIIQILLDTFKFKDMVFEFGGNGFAGILQNINLDQAMKIANSLYADIDAILMEMGGISQITIGITTRTARLLPASRMIEEADCAAKKAVEEPELPIVAFRANPEKYRNYVADKI